ncbi:MAG: diguanylate cyclase [Magnetococcus sp. DMHC-6]
MEKRLFGQTGIPISVFTLGTMRFLHGWDTPHDHLPDDSLENARQIIQSALDAGINLIETAHGYGKSERLIGATLANLKQPKNSYHLMTKAIPTKSGDQIRVRLEESLTRLAVDRVDFFALHGINTLEILAQCLAPNGPLAGLERAKQEGLIGHIGLSSHGQLPVLLEIIATNRFEFINLHYHFFRQKNKSAIDYAAVRNMGVLILSPNDKGGLLYNPPSKLKRLTEPLHPVHFNERWLLSHPDIHTLCIGMSEPKHIDIHKKSLNGTPYFGNVERAAALRLFQEGLLSPFVRCGECTQCAPCPEHIDIPEIMRLLHLARCLNMVEYARYRYAQMSVQDHWVPGAQANSCDGCNSCLPRCPQGLIIPALLGLAHECLSSTESWKTCFEHLPAGASDLAMDNVLRVDLRLRRALVEMTSQEEDVGLVRAMVRNIAILAPVSNVVFYEARKGSKESDNQLTRNDWLLFNPLNNRKEGEPVETIEGMLECLKLGQERVFTLSQESSLVRVIEPVRSEKFIGFLLIDCTEHVAWVKRLTNFFLRIFMNQLSLIHKKERDPLTGLLNRQSFDAKINRVLLALNDGGRRRADDTSGKGVILAVFDIDHFKRVNDQFGHLIGDEVLLLFSRIMEQCFRLTDFLFRFGGEEFIALLNDISPEEGYAALERFRRMVERYDFPQVGQVTVSIGSVVVSCSEIPSTLIEKADLSLYYAKNHGRNQVQVYQDLVASGELAGPDVQEDSEIDLWD